MTTTHRILCRDSSLVPDLAEGSVHLVVTSPPYPMVEMWDQVFKTLDPKIEEVWEKGDFLSAFHLMHGKLDSVWREVYRILCDGGFLCINIGDATRSLGGSFMLYPNHSRILQGCVALGFITLPLILWRKQTNAPNKFMGSGMLPAGAYVTLEHEYILILRKPGKRCFSNPEEKERRRRSSYFWEERNQWFSDVWDFKGIRQELQNRGEREIRSRSAAFPFELAYRLVNMFSLEGDTVFDPFAGTGTTNIAAVAAGRNSVGIDIDPILGRLAEKNLYECLPLALERIERRLKDHESFVRDWRDRKGEPKYLNSNHSFPVITKQETEILTRYPVGIKKTQVGVEVEYSEEVSNWPWKPGYLPVFQPPSG